MAAVDEIAVKLGIKTGDLKAALADAGSTVKKFKKDAEGDVLSKQFANAKQGIEKFRSALAGAGIVALLKSLGDAAVKFADDYTGAYDDAVAATLRLKNEQRDLSSILSGIVGRIGVEIVGAMDKFGIVVGQLVYGTDAAAEALSRLDAENKKAFDDAKAKKLVEAQEKLAKVMRDNALAAADDNAKVNILAAEYVKILQEQTKLQKDSVAWLLKAAEAEAKKGELAKADAEVRKKDAEDRKKATEDLARVEKAANDERSRNYEKLGELYEKERDSRRETMTIAERQRDLLTEERDLQAELNELEVGSGEYNEVYARLLEVRSKFRASETDAAKTNLEIAKLLLVPEEKRTEIQREQLKILTGETTEYDQQLELMGLLQKGVQNLTEAELARLRVLAGQTAEAKKMTEEQRQQIALQKVWASGIKQTGNIENLSDVQLDAVVQRLTQDLNKIKQADAQYAGVGIRVGSYKSVEQYLLQQNLDQAKKEQGLRSNFASTVSAFGTERAERTYAPDDFARLSQLLNPDATKQQTRDISAIANTLKNMFPDQYGGLR